MAATSGGGVYLTPVLAKTDSEKSGGEVRRQAFKGMFRLHTTQTQRDAVITQRSHNTMQTQHRRNARKSTVGQHSIEGEHRRDKEGMTCKGEME
jgi:hypothetical protein